ncbi:MAG: efflux RND transporter permease subunit, partial [Armatimonadetes bacterium]|nr:efflux RND transporter permease subunit [Armatimonadota bacterium]
MTLTRLSIRRPVLIAMAWLALGVLGLRFLSGMPVELLPNIGFPTLSILTVYPGAGPKEVETLITKPIEDAVGAVPGIDSIQSSSQEGVSLVVVSFVLGTNLDRASADAREKLDAIRATLPRDARQPSLQRFSFAADPILRLTMTSARSSQQFRDFVDNTLKARIDQISGVANVTVIGGDRREIQVNIDRDRLQAYGLGINVVSQLLVAENLNVPAGSISEGRRQYSIRALGEFRSVEEIRNLRVGMPGGGQVRLGDFAEVVDTVSERTQISRLNTHESVGIQIRKTNDANTIRVVGAVKAELGRIERDYPEVRVTVVYDQSVFVREAISDVFLALVLGALLAIVIVWLFLPDAISTFIISLSLPTSMLTSFIVISSFGFTLNFFTMLGLSLAIGVLIDDSIVVLENINRHIEMGETPTEAALNGRGEIGLAAVAITLVDVVVFVPIGIASGFIGQLFRPFALTIASVNVVSLFSAFTLTPMLAARWMRRRTSADAHRTGLAERFERVYKKWDNGYRGVLAWALGHRAIVLAIGLAAVVVVFPLSSRLGFEFISSPDQGIFGVTIEMPAGTNIETTDAVAKLVEKQLAARTDVEDVVTAVGTKNLQQSGPQFANLIVKLVEKHHRQRDTEIIRELQNDPAANRVPGAKIVYAPLGVGPPGAPLNLRVSGSDLDVLTRVAAQISDKVRAVPGTRNVDVSTRIGRPELQIVVDRVRAAEVGLTTGQITGVLRSSIEGNTDAKFRSGGEEYNIRLRMFDRGSKLDTQDVPDVLIGSVGGQPIYVRDVTRILNRTGPTQIDRLDRQRVVDVTGYIQAGFVSGNVVAAAQRAAREVPLPPGVRWTAAGEAEFLRESGETFAIALLLGIVLVYILLAALFESMFTPLAIMLMLPTALVGGILALLVTGKTLSMISAIGFVLLTGLVMKNSILVIDFTNTLRARGRSRLDALLEAGPTRLRPVLMTTLAVILGSLPTAWEFGEGAELRSPLAIAVIGGMIWSAWLTLLVIPVM